ncbi:MAG: hypothetical protein GY850_00870 [bacterium]|nr:hypothetical protein [bacterium]
MSDHISVDKLAQEIRQIYSKDSRQAEERIAAYMQEQLVTHSATEKIGILERLTAYFGASVPDPADPAYLDDEVLTRLFSLVLGDKVTRADLSSADLLQRLAESLNTIFDALNKLVAVIDSTLLGKVRGEETIRQVIGFHLEGQDQTQSLESYLGQINKAFLLAQQASKDAASQIVGKILQELDPEKISRQTGGGLKFGPLRKAELYSALEHEINKCRQWYESGRFMQDLQREFEKNCRPKPM